MKSSFLFFRIWKCGFSWRSSKRTPPKTEIGHHFFFLLKNLSYIEYPCLKMFIVIRFLRVENSEMKKKNENWGRNEETVWGFEFQSKIGSLGNHEKRHVVLFSRKIREHFCIFTICQMFFSGQTNVKQNENLKSHFLSYPTVFKHILNCNIRLFFTF